MRSIDSLINSALLALSNERKIFHSEADFKFALGTMITYLDSNVSARFEKPMIGVNGKTYIDIFLTAYDIKVGIELKFKLARLRKGKDERPTNVDGELFNPAHHGAADISRYDVLKDIMRLEQFKNNGDIDIGYAIFLTNYVPYWDNKITRKIVDGKARLPCDFNFRLWDGLAISGKRKWENKDICITPNEPSRSSPIILDGSYKVRWKDYSDIDCDKNGLFRYSKLKVN